jgi:hypothetical protein
LTSKELVLLVVHCPFVDGPPRAAVLPDPGALADFLAALLCYGPRRRVENRELLDVGDWFGPAAAHLLTACGGRLVPDPETYRYGDRPAVHLMLDAANILAWGWRPPTFPLEAPRTLFGRWRPLPEFIRYGAAWPAVYQAERLAGAL